MLPRQQDQHQKKEAVSAEDYATADRLKREIDSMTNEIRTSLPSDAMSSVAAVINAKEGWIWKKGGGSGHFGRRNWTERYFVCVSGSLTYFHNVEEYQNSKIPLKDSVYRLKHCNVRFGAMIQIFCAYAHIKLSALHVLI